MARIERIYLVILTLVALIAFNQLDGFSKLVRVKFNKYYSKNGGLLNQPQNYYYINVQIGTPFKSFKLLIDVNARETWIPHYLKLGILFQRLNYENGYSKKDSSSSIKEEKEYIIRYDTTELTGKVYKDLFELKDVLESHFPIKYYQRFLAISSASNGKFKDRFGEIDGVLPLNPTLLSEINSELPVLSLSRATITNDLKFSIHFEHGDNGEGEVAFGQVDSSAKFKGTLRYHSVIGQHNWDINVQSVMIGGDAISCLNSNCLATISTTLNDFSGPRNAVAKVLKLLQLIDSESDYIESKLYEIDCLRVENAPILTVVIDGNYYTLRPSSYVRKNYKKNNCYVGILSNGLENAWTLGTNFLENYHTIFDASARRIAFAIKK